MLESYEVVVLIRETTRIHAARCEVCLEVGSSPFPAEIRPVSHQIVLSVATSAWLHHVTRLSLFDTR